jgi:hypothetical protein
MRLDFYQGMIRRSDVASDVDACDATLAMLCEATEAAECVHRYQRDGEPLDVARLRSRIVATIRWAVLACDAMALDVETLLSEDVQEMTRQWSPREEEKR